MLGMASNKAWRQPGRINQRFNAATVLFTSKQGSASPLCGLTRLTGNMRACSYRTMQYFDLLTPERADALSKDRRETRFMRHEMNADKRLLGAFDTIGRKPVASCVI